MKPGSNGAILVETLFERDEIVDGLDEMGEYGQADELADHEVPFEIDNQIGRLALEGLEAAAAKHIDSPVYPNINKMVAQDLRSYL